MAAGQLDIGVVELGPDAAAARGAANDVVSYCAALKKRPLVTLPAADSSLAATIARLHAIVSP